MRETAADLCRQVEIVREPQYLNAGHPFSGWAGVFGRIGWPMAHYGALELVFSLATRSGAPWDVPSRLDNCRERWRALLGTLGETVKQVAVSDFETKIERDAAYQGAPDADLKHVLWELDVGMLSARGTDQVWPALQFEARLTSQLEMSRKRWMTQYAEAFRNGGWKDEDGEVYWPLRMEQLEEQAIHWLPDAFWWRHLPRLLGPTISSE